MSMKRCLPITALLFWFVSFAWAEKTYQGVGSPFAVETLKLEWHDAKRDRHVPAKIYFPKNATSPCPVIVFSHGLGGTRDGYEYLGQHWASRGYVSAHVQHHGSDDGAWRGTARPLESMRAATMNLSNVVDRPIDISFALDQLTKMNAQAGAWHGRLDMERVGVAGHSFGAYTTMAIAGQKFGPIGKSFADPRVKAAIAMSTPTPRRGPDRNYAAIKIPILHLTGTADVSPFNDGGAENRRVPFDSIHGPPQFLITFDGGDHMLFAGTSGPRRDAKRDAAMHDLILQSTTAFWDAYLRDDATAKKWLVNGGCKSAVDKAGVFEMKDLK